MTVFQDSLHDPNLRSDDLLSDNVRSDNVRPASPDSDAPVEFRLQPGERYGWWGDHEPEDAHEVAMVHGAVNDCRTKILLDIGASREVVWAGRGDRWVTKIIYASKSWPTAVKVVNISDKLIGIDTNTAIARIVEDGSFPRCGRFVRPGTRQYRE
ncbi:unnamed protein product [Phytophthora fragariaefolia]|uniref:Unnamed protein product n=1 Tax=Phytophthora fragariaefolia TaxID=1490495 RepID=A0A9W6TKU1_9STRA|nr:unnamed protein product [Phytophthora fragariaefolia]